MRQDCHPQIAGKFPFEPTVERRVNSGHDDADEALLGVRQAKQLVLSEGLLR